jgi:isoleucyl-tRNA synthetase
MDYYWLRKYFGKDLGNLICEYHHWNNETQKVRKLRNHLFLELLETTQPIFESSKNIHKYKYGYRRICAPIFKKGGSWFIGWVGTRIDDDLKQRKILRCHDRW